MGFCGVSQLTFSQERGHLSSLCYLIHAGLIGGFGLKTARAMVIGRSKSRGEAPSKEPVQGASGEQEKGARRRAPKQTISPHSGRRRRRPDPSRLVDDFAYPRL